MSRQQSSVLFFFQAEDGIRVLTVTGVQTCALPIYGFRPFVLGVSEVPGELEAGLPLLEVKDPIRGRRWVALPFTDRCPPLQSSSAAEIGRASCRERV